MSRASGVVKPRLVESLDIKSLPGGCVTHLRVVLTHDCMGAEMAAPVLVMRGQRPGPVFGITAAVHGNEVNGIPVIHGLMNVLSPEKLKGTVVAVLVVNLPGFREGTRAFSDGFDLNKIMPGKEAGQDGELFAYRFCDRILNHLDFLVDLHTASTGRVNSLYVRANMHTEMTARMAHLQRPEIILHNKPSDGTLRGYAESQGIPAITVEVGNPNRFHPEYIRRSIAGIRAVLSDVGMLPKRKRPPAPVTVNCGRSYWLYTDHGGLLEVFPSVTQRVEAGEVIARLTDIYGNVLRDYEAPESGIVIGKSVHPVGQSGARILHLGIPLEGSGEFLEDESADD